MNRIRACTAVAKKNGKKLFCPFITTGYPSLQKTKQLIKGFEEIGVDILELGIPFSDPVADGPVIQDTSYHAIEKYNVSLSDACDLVASVRKEGCELPIIFFTYFNPILHKGIKKSVAMFKRAGVDGVLCPDVPLGVEDELPQTLRKAGLSFIRLLAPNNTPARRKAILQDTDDFVYYVSRKGITGTQQALSKDLQKVVRGIKKQTKKLVLVGFGISEKKHVTDVVSVADGAIVGSAVLNVLRDTQSVEKTLAFTQTLVKGAAVKNPKN